jgi:hypothetical protein
MPTCYDLNKTSMLEYQKKYNQQNKLKIKQYQRDYYYRNKFMPLIVNINSGSHTFPIHQSGEK